jgi:hypothetical protein
MLPKILNSPVKLPQKTSKWTSQGPDFHPIHASRGGFLCKQCYYARSAPPMADGFGEKRGRE